MKGKILIVDDLADFRKLLRNALEDNNIITEADSKAALEKALTQEQPELVLLDVKLPDGNGLELLPAIKKALAGDRGHRPDRSARRQGGAVLGSRGNETRRL